MSNSEVLKSSPETGTKQATALSTSISHGSEFLTHPVNQKVKHNYCKVKLCIIYIETTL